MTKKTLKKTKEIENQPRSTNFSLNLILTCNIHIMKNRGGSRGRVQGVCTPPLPEMTCGFLIQLVFSKKKTMWLISVEVEQETSPPPPKKNPGSAPEKHNFSNSWM